MCCLNQLFTLMLIILNIFSWKKRLILQKNFFFTYADLRNQTLEDIFNKKTK